MNALNNVIIMLIYTLLLSTGCFCGNWYLVQFIKKIKRF